MDHFGGKFPYLPERIFRLGELACNLWWSWHPEARALFHMLSGNGAEFKAQNPVKLLHEMDRSVLDAAAKDSRFLRRYDAVMARFDAEMNAYGSWFYSKVADPGMHPVAYFSAEFGLHHSLPFYAGGLGFLAGDFLKECSDLGVPVVGVGFMYPEGYLHQRISPDGWQMNESEILDREHAPICRVLDKSGQPLVIKVPIIELPIYFEVWRAQIGRVPLYLIDTDIEGNDPWNRGMSARLYSGDAEQRLIQEILLGIGGTQILHALGIKHSILHLNEGHSAFAILERIREKVEKGMSHSDAADQVRATTVFTTHTPVPAGHDVFPFTLMEKYFGSYIPLLETDRESFFRLGVEPRNPTEGFNMAAFALRMSAHCNAVSKKHGEVASQMWQHLWPEQPEESVHIDYITNGVHVPTWIDSRIASIFNRYLGPNWLYDHDNPSIWELVDDIPDGELWRAHRLLKMIMIAVMQERARLRWVDDHADPNIVLASGVMFDPNTLTIGFARRFATYKRANLILQDMERLKRILNDSNRPVQIVFAGKAHPADHSGKQLIQQIFNAARDPSFGGRIAFIEDYDEELSQYLVHGVDVWLNNPLPPFEASGTSGMKAGINGVPHLSVLDGWWLEGYTGRNGWAFDGTSGNSSDAADAKELYTLLEKDIVPLYYDKDEAGISQGWVRVMKESIKSATPHFSSRRMVKEYALKFYQEALKYANGIES
ncbi:MAG TPA: alpha-glucan family phosphorylase [Methanotrichaceae archaeon]|nr:alpha-glucan family phosphorylase [Methanotrichaceae archaeon]